MVADVAREVREQLKPYLGRRIEVEGTMSRTSTVWDAKAQRHVPSVCFNNVEIRDGDHPVIDHVWVTWATMLINSGARPGDTLRFSVQVYDYRHWDEDDRSQVTTRFGLREPREIRCMNRTLTPVATEGPTPAAAVTAHDVPATQLPPEAPEPTAPPADPRRELFDLLWGAVDRFGIGKVKRTLSAVETLADDEGDPD